MLTNDEQERRKEYLRKMRAILDRAEAAKRNLTPEEEREFDDLTAKADRMQLKAQVDEVRGIPMDMSAGGGNDSETRAIVDKYLRSGRAMLDQREQRALQMDLADSGGYAVLPQVMAQQILQKMDDLLFIAGRATVYDIPQAENLGIPTLENNPADSDWTTELLTGSADSTMSFGKRELHPHPLAKSLRVSNKLLRASSLNIGDFVMNRLAYKMAVSLEKAFLTGNGQNQPMGIFTLSSMGLDASCDVSTGGATAALTADQLMECQGALKGQYRKNAIWIFSRSAITKIRKMKDGDGQYLWMPGLGNQPETLLGSPLLMSEYVPAVYASGAYVGAYFDPSFYWIARSLSMSIQVVDQLFAASNQTAYYARCEIDGMPTLPESVVRVKLA